MTAATSPTPALLAVQFLPILESETFDGRLMSTLAEHLASVISIGPSFVKLLQVLKIVFPCQPLSIAQCPWMMKAGHIFSARCNDTSYGILVLVVL
jgi:hypothetical protein